MAPTAAALERRITAWHEAAHAVVAFRFGIRVDELAICPSGPLAGYVRMLRPSMISLRSTWDDATSRLSWALVRRDTEHHVMVRLAGPIAEARLFGTPMRSHACESDLNSAIRLCDLLENYRTHLAARGVRVPAVPANDLAARLHRRTRYVLAYPRTWKAVRVLAADLEGWSRLMGHDAADTVQWTRRIDRQLSLLLPLPAEPGTRRPARSPRLRPVSAMMMKPGEAH